MMCQPKAGRNSDCKADLHRKACLGVYKFPEYVAYRRRQRLYLAAYAILTASIAWLLSFLPFREARVLSEILVSAGLILEAYGICAAMRRPKVLPGRIVSMEPKKLVWLEGLAGHDYLVQTESGTYHAGCIYGRLYGTEESYRENEPVWLLLSPSPHIMKNGMENETELKEDVRGSREAAASLKPEASGGGLCIMKLWNGKAKGFLKGLLRGIIVFAGAWAIMEVLEKLCGIPFKWSVVAAIWVLYYLLRYSVRGK